MRALVKITREGMTKIMDVLNSDDLRKAQEIKANNDMVINCYGTQTCDELIEAHNNSLKKSVKVAKKKAKKETIKKIDAGVVLWDLKKVTDEDWKLIFKCIKVQDYNTIFELHNSKDWTDLNYCCDSYIYHIAKNLIEARESVEIPENIIVKVLEHSGKL